MSSFRGSSWPRNQTLLSCISYTAGGFFTTEPPGKTLWMGILVFRTLSWGLYFRRISGQRMLCVKWDSILSLPLLLCHYAGTMSHDLKEMGLWLSCRDFRLVGSDCYSGFSKGSAVKTEKAMATHSSTLAWKIPWMEEPGRLQSMGLLRVRHDWATSLSLFTSMHWRRKWQPTPVLLPGESQGRGSLVGCHLWGRTELDTTEAT